MGDREFKVGVTGFAPLEQHLISGGELLRQDRVQEARKELEAALRIEPENSKVLGLLGLACFRMDDFASALPVYQKLVELHPRDASFALNLGLVYLKLGEPGTAIRQLERSRELDPSQSRALSYLGLAYARSGDYPHAYQVFLQAGDAELAQEMEQYLSEEQRTELKNSVAAQRAAPNDADTDAVDDDAEETSSAELDLADIEVTGDATTAVPPQLPGPPSGTGPAASSDYVANVEVDLDYDDVELISEAAIALPSERDLSSQTETDGAPGGQRPGAISEAVERATPSAAATAGAARVAVGNRPPQSLTKFATSRLIRPEDGGHTFEISDGGMLIIQVKSRIYARTEGMSVTGGELAYEVAARHSRGSSTGQDFSSDGRHLFIVSGRGHLIAAPLGQHFTAVTLDEDILYLREDLVFAFEEELRWENGHVPGSDSTLAMVQFRGQGSVAFRSKKPLLAVKLTPERILYVDAGVLAGW
ncbi:MAG: tetratricopeptide repeat protein, partial [Myxococcota bacterium]